MQVQKGALNTHFPAERTVMSDRLTPETSSVQILINRILILSCICRQYLSLGLGALPSSFSLLGALIKGLPNNSYRRQSCVWVLLGKAVTSPSILTLGLTPNPKSCFMCASWESCRLPFHPNTGTNSKFQELLHVLGQQQNKVFNMETSLRRQTLQVGPIKQ